LKFGLFFVISVQSTVQKKLPLPNEVLEIPTGISNCKAGGLYFGGGSIHVLRTKAEHTRVQERCEGDALDVGLARQRA